MNDAARNGKEVVLQADDLVAGYVDEVDILNGVSLTVREGEIVTVIGPNGAGKSTLIKTIFGLLHPRTGSIVFQGSRISKLKPHRLVRLGMGYVPQLDNVFPSLTVSENLEMGSLDPRRSQAQTQRMFEIFPRLGERRDQAAGTMSGGERQMVAMAKALMPEPKLLLLDEPSAGLAPAFVDAIFEKVEEINKAGVTIVMVEQNARRALAMSHRGYVLDVGQNRYEGTGRDLLEDPNVAQLYLGGTARVDEAEVADTPRNDEAAGA
jgi:ABC-type branched-subunit amino acid transport system ATPase component